MKNIQRFLFVALAALMISGTAFAQTGGDTTRNPKDTISHPRDTIKHPKDTIRNPKDTIREPKDTSNHPKEKKAPCRILQIDSCREMFLASIPADDAANIRLGLAEIDRLMNALNALNAQFKAAREAKDTAQMRAVRGQIKDLRKQMQTANKALGDLLRKYRREFGAAADACCGHRKPAGKGTTDSKDQGLLKIAPIVPNPVQFGAPSAQFNYSLAADATVTIAVADQLGNVIKTIQVGPTTAGDHNFVLDLAGLQPGGYLVRVQAGNSVQTLKLLITQ